MDVYLLQKHPKSITFTFKDTQTIYLLQPA